jgi:hypothetical protein
MEKDEKVGIIGSPATERRSTNDTITDTELKTDP